MAEEKRFENKLKKYLESKGIYRLGTPKQKQAVKMIGYWEKRFGCTFSVNGAPDMHCCINGKSLDIEVKASRGRPSPVQLKIIEQINNCGGKAMLVYPNDYDKFVKTVEDMINE